MQPSKASSVEWALTDGFLQNYFDRGVRHFFGVTIDKSGKLLSDDQQPDFFKKYQQRVRN